jgi:hypothetical protein
VGCYSELRSNYLFQELVISSLKHFIDIQFSLKFSDEMENISSGDGLGERTPRKYRYKLFVIREKGQIVHTAGRARRNHAFRYIFRSAQLESALTMFSFQHLFVVPLTESCVVVLVFGAFHHQVPITECRVLGKK